MFSFINWPARYFAKLKYMSWKEAFKQVLIVSAILAAVNFFLSAEMFRWLLNPDTPPVFREGFGVLIPLFLKSVPFAMAAGAGAAYFAFTKIDLTKPIEEEHAWFVEAKKKRPYLRHLPKACTHFLIGCLFLANLCNLAIAAMPLFLLAANAPAIAQQLNAAMQ